MKYALLSLLVCCVLGSSTYLLVQEQYTEEEQAIIDVINADRLAFAARDYDTWADQWARKPYTAIVWSSPNSYLRLEGWESISMSHQEQFRYSAATERAPGIENPWGEISFRMMDSDRLWMQYRFLDGAGNETWHMNYELVRV